MQKDEEFGEKGKMASATWNFFNNPNLGSTTSQQSFTNDIINAVVTVDAASGSEYPYAGYGVYQNPGYFKGLTHIEVTYETTAPLALKFSCANDQPWEVVLGNVGPETKSGPIPISAFHYNMYDTTGTNTAINTADINGIEVQLITSAEQKEEHTVTVKDIILYGAEGAVTAISDNTISPLKQHVSVQSLTRTMLRLKLAREGKYTVSIMTANGRVVQSFKDYRFYAGTNNLKMSTLSSGLYIINVRNGRFKQSIKSLVM